jgi:hypothetical protein
MMKTMKTTLCATAALVAITTVARADGLENLKSMMEGLNGHDLVFRTALQVPRGFKISPTADTAATTDVAAAVEEPFVEYKVSGYIKAGYIYSQIKDTPPAGSPAPKDASSDFDVEGGVNVKGSVQSALGEVGATIQAKWDIAESLGNAATHALRDDGLIGFWQFADTMKLEMGRGNAGRMENGIDKNTRRIWTIGNRRVRSENAGNGFYDRDMYNGFLGLAYASGPITLNIRAHDATRGVTDAGGFAGYDDDATGVSGKFTYSADVISLEATGGYWGQDNASMLPIARQTGVKWLAGVGTEIDAIEGIAISVAGQMGELHSGAKMTDVSGSLGFTLTDTINAGVGGGWKKITNSPTLADNRTERVITGGIYYSPMSYLTLGAEADWLDDGKPAATTNDGYTAAIVTRYAF